MKRVHSHISILTVFILLLISILQSFETKDIYFAASSYTNAKEFYESTALDGQDYHIDMINGTIYYATSARIAHSSTNLRYYTLGFDITLSGNGYSVSFTVQRAGGSMVEINNVKDSTHEYNLYAIKDDTLYRLAQVANPSTASYVLSAPIITVKMDAILTTMKNNQLKGGITENGSGGFSHWGTIYRLTDANDLASIKRLFTGHDFKSYYNIKRNMSNHLLQIRYNAQGLNSTSSTIATVSDNTYGISVIDGFIAQNGVTYLQNQRILQNTWLLNPYSIHLQKEGYHLATAQEWITPDGRSFHPSYAYMPQVIEPLVGSQDKGITMYANWIANQYTTTYDANGGIGTLYPSHMTYDTEYTLARNTFTRTGYALSAGKEWMDANGKTYTNGQIVKNLTAENGATITLFSNWEPCVYKVTLNHENADQTGTSQFHVKYDIGNYANATCTTSISKITIPTKKGYTFKGYYSARNGAGICYVNSNGKILSESTTFISDTTLYANWEANTYTIKYHANGGIGTMTDTSAFYDTPVSLRTNTFENIGHMFIGWNTKADGSGKNYDNRVSVENLTSTNGDVIDLYAIWKPLIIHISLDAQDGNDGTKEFYEKYGNGFYSQQNCETPISNITIPKLEGYTFQGYFEQLNGFGQQLINKDGAFLINNKFFLKDTTLFANWKANIYKITFDKQEGTQGSSSVKVTYNTDLPSADAPVKPGYTFKGYWTEKKGAGTMYYNEYMVSDLIYRLTSNLTLFANWIDEEPPTITLRSTSTTWTNSKIKLTADAKDLGEGLSTLTIYGLDADGNMTEVKTITDLNGAKTKTLSYTNPTEGVIRYKAIATDKNGLSSEAYCTVYYDKTAPRGTINESTINGTKLYFNINVSDVKAQ